MRRSRCYLSGFWASLELKILLRICAVVSPQRSHGWGLCGVWSLPLVAQEERHHEQKASVSRPALRESCFVY